MTPTVTIPKSQYEEMVATLRHYRELLDTFDAVRTAESEKKSGKLKKLHSLAELMG